MKALPEVDFHRRFGGLERLYGVASARRIQSAHVAVVGLGGVGSWAAEALARSGVERLSLIDLDHVAESNVNRQIHACDETLGMPKVQAMSRRIAAYHPKCVVTCVEEFVDEGNWPALLPQGVDAVIDACDQVRAKTAMAAWAMAQGRNLVLCGAAGGKKQAHRVQVADLVHVTHDPLLAQVRQRLRKHHGAESGHSRPGQPKSWGMSCVYSTESVAPPDASCRIDQGDGSLNCHGYGSLVTVTATFGLCAAGLVMEWLSGTAT